MPDATVLNGISVEDISIADMLARMNKRIAVLYDREYTIGHAYFIPLRDNTELNEVLQERAKYDEFSAKGLVVEHKAFGSGVVIAHNGNLLNIRFGEQEKRFQMPQGFSSGFLKKTLSK